MKKSFATLTFASLAFAATMIPGLIGKYSASAKSELNSSHTFVSPAASASAMSFSAQDAATATTQGSGVVMPQGGIYALNHDNTLYLLKSGATSFTRLVRVTGANGNLIGIDFRPADGKLYALTDNGGVFTINLTTSLGAATRVSTVSPRFDGGFQSLMDFNPVVNALRVIGSNDQNYALVNSNGGSLNVTAAQTAMSYPTGDLNAGADPNIACGSYTNNVNGAQVTLFYGIDYAFNTFVTIPPAAPGGSSATGGGQLQTIGRLVNTSGVRINVSPTADCDISTVNGVNRLVGISARTLFTIDLNQINQNLARGTTQNVVVRSVTLSDVGGGFLDIAVPTP